MHSTYADKPAVLVPALTPFAADFNPNETLFIEHCKDLLNAGADGLAVFGTTSEANSLSGVERINLLEALVASKVAPATLMPGCGCCALPETVNLIANAIGLGCAGVLVMPPFFIVPQR